jgi:hypothetical protein
MESEAEREQSLQQGVQMSPEIPSGPLSWKAVIVEPASSSTVILLVYIDFRTENIAKSSSSKC